MTLAEYLAILRRYRLFILLVTVACAGAAYGVSKLMTPTYEATASITVRDPGQDLNLLGTPAGSTSFQTQLQIASQHVPDVTRTSVVQAVRRSLGLKASVNAVRSLVSVEVDPNSYVLNIRSSSASANQAARVANAFARADARLTSAQSRRTYAAAAKRLSKRIKQFGSSNDLAARSIYLTRLSNLQALSSVAQPIQVSSEAQVPSAAASPKTLRNTVAAAIIGLLLGTALAYARSMLDRRLRRPEDAEKVFEHPVLVRLRGKVFGHTGSSRDADTKGLGALEPVDFESFVRLRENVRYLAVDRELRTILVTSAVPEEGKSTVAACLAIANAAGGRTLLVECDLRRPVLADRLGIAASPGLSDYLVGRSAPTDILQQVPALEPGTANGSGPSSIVCVTAGSPPPRPDHVLNSQRFVEFLRAVGKAYDQVIIDSPPLLAVADTLEIVPHVDCVLMCVRMNKTTLDQAEGAREALDRLSHPAVGLVITDYTDRRRDYYGGYYQYSAEAEPTTRGRDKAEKEAVASPSSVA